jgi:hypothetical protein
MAEALNGKPEAGNPKLETENRKPEAGINSNGGGGPCLAASLLASAADLGLRRRPANRPLPI